MAQISWSGTGGLLALKLGIPVILMPILDDPEQFLRKKIIDYSLEIGCGVEPLGEFSRFHAGPAVTIGAAVLGIGLARLHAPGPDHRAIPAAGRLRAVRSTPCGHG